MMMTLRELCEKSKVSRRAIQGYEAAKLVKATGKNKYGYLVYDEAAQERVNLIKTYQRMGFSLKEICDIIDKDDSFRLSALKVRLEKLLRESSELDETIIVVKTMIDELQGDLK
ncbi:MAG: MerR family transcriptional regulator [Pseudobutyrivibrio sp.]|nr:MerR family transcriptional regulator [Pseudobutyrivibrio sp.]